MGGLAPKKRTAQAVLASPSLEKQATCRACGMSYHAYVAKDKAVHAKYHEAFVNGPRLDVRLAPVGAIKVGGPVAKAPQCSFYKVPKGDAALVRRAASLLEMVNRELNAPAENPAWKAATADAIQGHAFLGVVANRAVAICVTEPVGAAKGRWMVHRTQEVVPDQTNNSARLGVARIWVAPAWRRRGLAGALLECARRTSVYGMELHKSQVAFSQPSHSGGLLAKAYNGVRHRSGETLVPVYLE